MSGTEKDVGKVSLVTTSVTTPPGPSPDYIGWFAGAAQRMLLQKADIKQYVANHGRLQDFDTEMANWGQRFNGDGSSLAEGSEVLFGICQRFELLKFVGSPRSRGPGPTRGAVRAVRGAGDVARIGQLRSELARAYGVAG